MRYLGFWFSLLTAAIVSAASWHISPFDSPEFCSQIITSTCDATFSYIDEVNAAVRPAIRELVKTDYFRYFKLDLDKQCKFWNAQHFCATENCAVEVLEQFNWTDVQDDQLKPSKLGQINRPTQAAQVEGNTCEDLDYCHIDDDHHCVYVDLVTNPERFTGYGGNQSMSVWHAIYSENCFPNTSPMSMRGGDEPEKCVEKNLFFRLVSGMHASIAVHLANEYLDTQTGEFYPDLGVFMDRVGQYNDRLSNIYFNYALLSQAVVKLNELVPLQQFVMSGEHTLHVSDTINATADSVFDEYSNLFGDILPTLGQQVLFNSSTLFDPATTPPNLKDEFRSRFKNISAIMDCVGCDRCRMWGKVQTIGYGTALKVLFDGDHPDGLAFRRIEVVALINTLDRLSKSLDAINNFKEMYEQHVEDVAKGKAKKGEYEREGHTFAFPFGQKQTRQTASAESEVKPEPVKVKKTLPPGETGFFSDLKLEFDRAFEEVWATFKFIMRAYYNFPRWCFNQAVVLTSTLWDFYIGKTVYVDPSKVEL
ncbi:endoplasmic oxidoreductin-1 [Diutina catenulata]